MRRAGQALTCACGKPKVRKASVCIVCSRASRKLRLLRLAGNCIQCGRAFNRSKPRGRDKLRFCSVQCSGAYRHAVRAAREAARRAEREARRRVPKVYIPRTRTLRCESCGVEFTQRMGRPRRWCSRRCYKASPSFMVLRQRQHRDRKHRERASKVKVQCEAFHVDDVFARDGWRCQLCGRLTPKKRRGKFADNAPEIDHIVPLALGGSHSWANVQCACRRCNGRKGATVLGQFRLDWQLGKQDASRDQIVG